MYACLQRWFVVIVKNVSIKRICATYQQWMQSKKSNLLVNIYWLNKNLFNKQHYCYLCWNVFTWGQPFCFARNIVGRWLAAFLHTNSTNSILQGLFKTNRYITHITLYNRLRYVTHIPSFYLLQILGYGYLFGFSDTQLKSVNVSNVNSSTVSAVKGLGKTTVTGFQYAGNFLHVVAKDEDVSLYVGLHLNESCLYWCTYTSAT